MEGRAERAGAGKYNELPLKMENFPWKYVIQGLRVAGSFLLIFL